MLTRRHDFILLRSLTRVHSCCQLSVNCRDCQLRSVSSFLVPVNYIHFGNRRQTIDESNVCSCRPKPVTKRFYTALLRNVNIRASTQPALSSRVTGLQWPSSTAHGHSRLLPNVRWFTLSPKAIVEASPLYIQPYLRLIRLDRPIGMCLEIAAGCICF